MFGAWTE